MHKECTLTHPPVDRMLMLNSKVVQAIATSGILMQTTNNDTEGFHVNQVHAEPCASWQVMHSCLT